MQTKLVSILALVLLTLVIATAFGPAVYADGTAKGSDAPEVKVENGQMVITGAGFGEGGSDGAWTNFLEKYRKIIGGVSGTVAITLFIALIIQIGRLGVNSTTPQGRSSALSAIMWTLIATAILGAVGIFFSFFYGAIG